MHLRKWQIKWLNGRSIPLFDSPDVPVRKVLAVRPSRDRAVLPVAFLLLLVVSSPRIHAGQFVNLDFESPNLPIHEVGFLEGLAIDALPGWRPLIGSVESSSVLLNTTTISSASFSLFGPLTKQANPNHNLYSLRLYSGDAINRKSSVSISQSGLISEASKSLRLEARIFGEYHVTLDGTPISMSLSATGTDFDTYFGHISSFSGRTVELKIETGIDRGVLNRPFMYIGEVGFSTSVVPEPNVYTLIAIGLLGVIWRARYVCTR